MRFFQRSHDYIHLTSSVLCGSIYLACFCSFNTNCWAFWPYYKWQDSQTSWRMRITLAFIPICCVRHVGWKPSILTMSSRFAAYEDEVKCSWIIVYKFSYLKLPNEVVEGDEIWKSLNTLQNIARSISLWMVYWNKIFLPFGLFPEICCRN